jgi:Rps23 Pro-64 3,4-dihydroxylase Tpa1-like proline 4-hydroxylase
VRTSTCFVFLDVLLCHDDELDTRRIAFILYLVPVWTKDDGGLLDLFDMDGKYHGYQALLQLSDFFSPPD